ncbi:MAG: tRNA uridine-5-carboxymethylaminomethyl(34) synthesis GTPase MnmE [Elusimicrobiota bacterium]|jgi:tRNA modification GTPase|nr:tRNA uridine-5-carboxymethylaminomethyl(34) synthesis GTPase MnmE [Elusimicrobiota bacterium]
MDLFKNDTIFAFASAPSSGAVAMLRISGAASVEILSKITRKKLFEPRRATLVEIYDGKERLDKAVAVVYRAPKSYTGEDIVEISLHAGHYIKGRVLEILSELGIRPAKAGEFTMRAFFNGKIDLAQAQGVADIIASKNKAAHKAAMNSLDGGLSGEFKNIKNSLRELLAQIEVRIDDGDGELAPLNKEFSLNQIKNIIEKIKKLTGTFCAGKAIKDGVRVAIVGIPNGGKSSLLNALLGYDRAIVSPVGGTTRDTVEANFEINGVDIILTDTAGIREHSLDPAEKEGMLRSRRAVQNSDIVIFVKDGSSGINQKQEELFNEIKKEGKNTICVINKSDLLPESYNPQGSLLISCVNGSGIEKLKNKIIEVSAVGALQEDGMLITSALHYDALLKASRELELATAKLADLELAAEHIRSALQSMQSIIGETTADDILDIIFSKFCIGK